MTAIFRQFFQDKKVIQKLKDTIAKKLKIALTDEIAIIKERTTAGKDYRNANFVAYSKEYREQRIKEGRNSYPDLTRTGNMLKALTVGKIVVGEEEITGKIIMIDTGASVQRSSDGTASLATASEKVGFNEKVGRIFFKLSQETLAKIKDKIFR